MFLCLCYTQAVLRAYYWLHAEGSLSCPLVSHRGPEVVLGIDTAQLHARQVPHTCTIFPPLLNFYSVLFYFHDQILSFDHFK